MSCMSFRTISSDACFDELSNGIFCGCHIIIFGYLNLESKFDMKPMWNLFMVEGSDNHKYIIIIV